MLRLVLQSFIIKITCTFLHFLTSLFWYHALLPFEKIIHGIIQVPVLICNGGCGLFLAIFCVYSSFYLFCSHILVCIIKISTYMHVELLPCCLDCTHSVNMHLSEVENISCCCGEAVKKTAWCIFVSTVWHSSANLSKKLFWQCWYIQTLFLPAEVCKPQQLPRSRCLINCVILFNL